MPPLCCQIPIEIGNPRQHLGGEATRSPGIWSWIELCCPPSTTPGTANESHLLQHSRFCMVVPELNSPVAQPACPVPVYRELGWGESQPRCPQHCISTGFFSTRIREPLQVLVTPAHFGVDHLKQPKSYLISSQSAREAKDCDGKKPGVVLSPF